MTFDEWLETWEVHHLDPYAKFDKYEIGMYLEKAFDAGYEKGYNEGRLSFD